MTHQDIVDRMAALSHDQSEAYAKERARIAKEQESLRELCGGLGHVFKPHPMMIDGRRLCVFCDAREPKPVDQGASHG